MSYARKIGYSLVALALPAAVALVGGCDKGPNNSGSAGPAGGTMAAPPATTRPTTGPSMGSTSGMPGTMPSMNTPGLPSELPRLPDLSPSSLPTLPTLPSGTGDAPPLPGTADAGTADAAVSPEAASLLSQAMTHVKENKHDLAEKALAQLEGMKASLPASFQSKIDATRQALTAAKAGAGGVKLPEGLPGLK